MKGMRQPSDKVKVKDIVSLSLSFENRHNGERTDTANRPCLVTNVSKDFIKCHTITSQTSNKIAKLYGVPLKKGQMNGLNKDSSVLCTKDNQVYVRKKDFASLKKIGSVSDREMVDVLNKTTMCNRKKIQTKYRVHQSGLSR